jgi:hypothetical protein
MRLGRIDRLFHSLVVVGAALGAGGCSSTVDTQNAGAGGGSASGGQDGGATSGAGGAGGAGGADAGADAGDAGPIDDAGQCPSATQFFCEWTPDGTVCHCDPTAPAGPEACAHTQDFHCNEYTPVYTGCTCRPGSPLTAADCPDPQFFVCAVQDPPIGCDCLVPIK